MLGYVQNNGHLFAGGLRTFTPTVSLLSTRPFHNLAMLLLFLLLFTQAFKKPPSFENRGVTRVCLGHDNRIAGGSSLSQLRVASSICSAKVRNLGENVGQGPSSRLSKCCLCQSQSFPGTNGRRITRDFHTHRVIESLDCEIRPIVLLHRRCLRGCGYATPMTRDIESPPLEPHLSALSLLLSGGGGFPILFKNWYECAQCLGHTDIAVDAAVC